MTDELKPSPEAVRVAAWMRGCTLSSAVSIKGAAMIIDVECPTCHGNGEVCGVSPNRRSRFVGYDDLSPDDFTRACPRCLGTGAVEHDLNEDCDDD